MRMNRSASLILASLLCGALLFLAACEGDSSGSGVGDHDAITGDTPGIPGDDAEGGDAFAKPDGLDPGQTCRPGASRCDGERERFVCLPDGSAWILESCPEETVCRDGQCHGSVCIPNQRVCLDGGAGYHQCNARGDGWGTPTMCDEGEGCIDGVCLPVQCRPGDVLCGTDSLLMCTGDGLGWRTVPCPEGQICFAGKCVECVNKDQCGPGEMCSEAGMCVPEPIRILRASPPEGVLGASYTYQFEATGGLPPYDWSVYDGGLPPGLSLAASGALSGTPSAAGTFAFSVKVLDELDSGDSADVSIMVSADIEGVRITTTSPLPRATEGDPYTTQLSVAGGSEPYAWMINAGQLPNGLSMTSTGRIAGTPDMDVGEFVFNVRVFDNSPVPTWDEKEFLLNVALAPLRIIGEQEFDLLVTKVIVLPLLTIIENIPILPYDTQLQARGGLRPYQWQEIEIPSFLSFLIPRSGVPTGLTLSNTGRLSGTVRNSDDVICLSVPFTEIELCGFFFVAEVSDSQNPAEKRTGVFLIPTLPIGF